MIRETLLASSCPSASAGNNALPTERILLTFLIRNFYDTISTFLLWLNWYKTKTFYMKTYLCLSYLASPPLWSCGPTRAMVSSFLRFLVHTQRRTTVGRTPLDEWSARRRDLYLTTHNTQQQTNIRAPGAIRTHDLGRRAAADLCLRPRVCWDRHISPLLVWI
jgi:hypothetical protein